MRRNSCDGIILSVFTVLGRTVQLSGLGPLRAFVACEFEGKALCADYHSADINEDVAVYCLASEVEGFVSLDKESCHHF